MANDVTALVMISGESEDMVARCLDAISAQTRRPVETCFVRHVTPFHAAFAQGVAQVHTPYLWQVDPDMIPDPDCLELLCAGMDDSVGMTMGDLMDPMLGSIKGIKLFNRGALLAHPVPESLVSESRQVADMGSAGFRLRSVLRDGPAFGHPPHVLGRHEPDFGNLALLTTRFQRMGAKLRKRGGMEPLQDMLDRIGRSEHPMRHLAMLAYVEGLLDDDHPEEHPPLLDAASLAVYEEFQGEPEECLPPFEMFRVPSVR